MLRVRHLTERPSQSPEPALLKYRSSKWFILATVCFASFSDAFTYGVMVPVFPFSLRARSGVDEDHIQQRVSQLLAVFGGAECLGAPFFGWLVDRTSSRRAPFLFGLILNAGATALLCFARNIYVLLLSRALQGFSAAIVYTVGFALLADTIGSKSLGEWMGYNIMSVNIGITASPTVGGLLFDHAGYYPIFGIMAVLIGLDILLRLVLVEKKTAAEWMEDYINTGENPPTQYGTFEPSSAETSQPEYPSTKSTDDSSSEHHERSSLTENNASIEHQDLRDGAADRTASFPTLLILLSSPRVLADLYASLVTVSILTAFDSALPIFLERTFGWRSTGGGLIFFTITLPILGAPLAGNFTDRYQSRWIPAIGFIVVGILTALLQLVKHDSAEQVALLVSLLTLNGCVRVVSSSPLGADLYRAVKEMEEERPGLFGKSGAYGQVFSLYTMASAAGVFLGPLWAGYAYGDHDWTFLVSTLGGFCASVALPLILSNTSREKEEERSSSSSFA